MREVLASIPGFSIKPRRRTNKKMSTAAQIEQTREGCIDLETPDSILVSTNLRDLLNKDTFCLLPPLYQYKLVQLLPNVDRPVIENDTETIRLNSSSLTNEFFARACLEWRERLAEGEFTPENQLKLRTEAEKEKIKLDPWKLKHFEPIWGDKSNKSKLTNRMHSKSEQTSMPITTKSTKHATSCTPSATLSKVLIATSTESSGDLTMCTESKSVAKSKPIIIHDATQSTSSTVYVSAERSVERQILTATATTATLTPPFTISDRPSLKTTIKLRPTAIASNVTTPLNTSHNYTTSSGRIVKSPNNYISTQKTILNEPKNNMQTPHWRSNAIQTQKRARIGAATRSTSSSSSTLITASSSTSSSSSCSNINSSSTITPIVTSEIDSQPTKVNITFFNTHFRCISRFSFIHHAIIHLFTDEHKFRIDSNTNQNRKGC